MDGFVKVMNAKSGPVDSWRRSKADFIRILNFLS